MRDCDYVRRSPPLALKPILPSVTCPRCHWLTQNSNHKQKENGIIEPIPFWTESQHTEGNRKSRAFHASENAMLSQLPYVPPTQVLTKRQHLCSQTTVHASSQPHCDRRPGGEEMQSSCRARRQGCQATACWGRVLKWGKETRYKLHLLMWGNGSPSICFSSCFHWVIGVDVTKWFGHKCFLHQRFQAALWEGYIREACEEHFLCQLVIIDYTARTKADCHRFSRWPAPWVRSTK